MFRPGAMVGAWLAAFASAIAIGAGTNAVLGATTPEYFENVMGWERPTVAVIVAQGIYEGSILGGILATVFAGVGGALTGLRATLADYLPSLWFAVRLIVAAWGLGALIGMGLALLSPEWAAMFYYATPQELPISVVRLTGVAGAIKGLYFGGPAATVLSLVHLGVRWRRK